MSFAEHTVFGGGDPLEVIERRRRSPLGLNGSVGLIAAETDGGDEDAPRPAAPPAARPARRQPAAAPENSQEDLARVRRALQEAKAPGAEPDDGAPARHPKTPRAADVAAGLRRFQAAAGLTVDGFAKPGGPTDAALDNRRRRVWRLASQGRRPAEETIDDRLEVFQEGRARRRQLLEDDFAALTASRTGRLHLIRLARTTDPDAARPILAQELARLRAERAPTRLKDPPDDGSRPLPDGDGRAPGDPGPPDDGSRPPPGGDDGSGGRPPGMPGPPDDGSRPLPGDEEPPPEPDECGDERRAVQEAEEEVARLQQALDDLTEDYQETMRKIEALRAEIRELEAAAAREEAALRAAPTLPKLFMDRKGRMQPPSKIEILAFLLEMALSPRIANRGESAALAEMAKQTLQALEDRLPILQQAIEDTTKRLQEAKAALARANDALSACQSATV